MAGIYCGGDGKLEKLKETCSALNVNLKDVHYYGDSLSDIPVLSAVGHPFCCNPMVELRPIAEQHNYQSV